MSIGRLWRAVGWVLVPAVVAGTAAGCGSSGSGTADAKGTSAAKSLSGAFDASALKGALLTKVNGVAAAGPASIGKYSSLSTSTGQKAVTVTPKSCSGAATAGFNPTALSGSPAAVVTFKVGTNSV